MKPLELLAPAGSYEGLVAAINAGADAVYIGGSKFSARAYAHNAEEEQLIAGIEYAHLRGKKVYLTVNTLMKNQELNQLYDYLKGPYEAGLDAVIVQDLGALKLIGQQFPDMELHASTQMSITGLEGFCFLESLGVTRAVPARELSLKEIAYIHQHTNLEIEAFIHGALCYSYSGQCLLSSLIGGRSGNRGRCAQPCRLPYSFEKSGPKYLLSPKDLCTIDLIPQLIEAGVVSFKIEGRMKRPEYAAGVVEIYRKALDGQPITKEDRTQLLNLYSRGGNCSGYLNRHNGKDMITLSSPGYRTGDESLFTRLHKDYLEKNTTLDISGHCILKKGRNAILKLSCQDAFLQVEGDIPDIAKKQPLNAEDVKKRLKKTGGTDFALKDLSLELDDGLFMPIQSLNTLKRDGLEQLSALLLQKRRRTAVDALDFSVKKKTSREEKAPDIHVLVTNVKQAGILLHYPEIKEVYLDSVLLSQSSLSEYESVIEALKASGKRVFLALPHIFRQSLRAYFLKQQNAIFLKSLDGCLIRNWESYGFVKELCKKDPLLDYEIKSDSNVYCFNALSKDFLHRQGIAGITLPVELNQKELSHLADENCEWIVYSHLPLMISAQCVLNTTSGCTGKSGITKMKDRLNKTFYVRNYCDCCYTILYNGTPMILWDKKIPAGAYRLDFHIESPKEVDRILKAVLFNGHHEPEGFFTRGHFNRGVE